MAVRRLPKVTGANSRPASPFEAGRQFERASCAPPFLPAAVAHFYRSVWKKNAGGVTASRPTLTPQSNAHPGNRRLPVCLSNAKK
jgi:hypothetical protein